MAERRLRVQDFNCIPDTIDANLITTITVRVRVHRERGATETVAKIPCYLNYTCPLARSRPIDRRFQSRHPTIDQFSPPLYRDAGEKRTAVQWYPR